MPKSAIELVIDGVHKHMLTPSVPFYVGNKHRAEHKEARCVVWVPRRGVVGAPKRLTHEHPVFPERRMRPLYGNALVLDAFLYATALDELESLWCEVLSATHAALGVSSQPGDYVILTEEEGAGVSRGDFSLIVQRFTFDMVLSEVGGTKTDPTVWVRERIATTVANTTYGIDPLLGLEP